MAQTAYEKDILGLLQRLGPENLLGIGDSAGVLVQAFAARHPGRRVLQLQVSDDTVDLSLDEPFDFVLVTDTLEHLPKRKAGILLSRLRDLYARYLLVAVDMGRHRVPGRLAGRNPSYSPTACVGSAATTACTSTPSTSMTTS